MLDRPVLYRLRDLRVYTGAVEALHEQGSLYGFVAPNRMRFTYPPFAGVLMGPLRLPQPSVLDPIWTLLTVAVVVAIAAIAGRELSRRLPAARRPLTVPMTAIVLLVSVPVVSNLQFGQVSILLCLMVLWDALDRKPSWAGGLLTGVAAAVKLTPLIFIPYFWLSGRRKVAVRALGTFLACTALAWIALPADSGRFWLHHVFETGRIGNLAHPSNQSINGMLRHAHLPPGTIRAGVIVLGALVAVLGLQRAARAGRNGHLLLGAAITGATSVALSPISWKHHQLWLLLAAAGAVGRRRSLRAWWSLGVVAIMMWRTDTLLAHVRVPVVSFLAANIRGLLAVAIACCVPFAELSMPRHRRCSPGRIQTSAIGLRGPLAAVRRRSRPETQ
jgi:alpha-1,2-mannosyltransferase